MRILHTADWHLGRALEGRDRLTEQEEFTDEICEIAREEDIDLIVIAGDVYDTVNPKASAEALFYETVKRLSDYGKRAVLVIAGNHDSPDRLCAARHLAEHHGIALSGLPAEPLVSARQTVGRVGWEPLSPGAALLGVRGGGSVEIVSLPYPSEVRLGKVLGERDGSLATLYTEQLARVLAAYTVREANAPRLLVSHLFVQNAKESESERPIAVGGAHAIPAQTLTKGFDYVALGHLHRPQTITASVPVRYAGSPLSYSFSEAGQAKSVSLVEFCEDNTPTVREIFLNAGKPLVRWVAHEGLSKVHEWLREGRDKNAWIDLEIHLTESLTALAIKELRKAHPGIISIRPVHPEMEITQRKARSSLPLSELFTEFYRQKELVDPDGRLVNLFLELVAQEEEEPERGDRR